MKDHSPMMAAMSDYAKERLMGSPVSDTPYSFDAVFCGNAYARVCLSIIRNYRINPEIMLMYARLSLAFKDENTATVFLIDRRRKVKDVFRFARGYKARISNFTDKIALLCEKNRTKRFVIAFNYNYKGTVFDELWDIDRFYTTMTKSGYIMMDCIKVQNGNATSLMLPYNKSGYK